MVKLNMELPTKVLSTFRVAKSLKNYQPCAPPLRVQVEITNRCNLRCVMCDRWKWASEEKKTLDELSIEKLVQLFEELKHIGVKEVLLTGGETMIRKDFSSIIQHIKKIGLQISIITNGTMVTDEIARALALANAKVTFSMDGDKEIHDRVRGVQGTFERAVKGIKKIAVIYDEISNSGELEVNYTIQKSNVKKMTTFLEIADNLKIDRVLFNLVHGNVNAALGKKDVPILKTELEKIVNRKRTTVIVGDIVRLFAEGNLPVHDIASGYPVQSLFKKEPVPCFAAYQTSFIDCSGSVFPCCYCYLDNASFSDHQKERDMFCLGNIKTNSFSQIWEGNSGGYKKFRKKFNLVKIKKSGICCGQCLEYFQFRKINKIYNYVNTIPFLFEFIPKYKGSKYDRSKTLGKVK